MPGINQIIGPRNAVIEKQGHQNDQEVQGKKSIIEQGIGWI